MDIESWAILAEILLGIALELGLGRK